MCLFVCLFVCLFFFQVINSLVVHMIGAIMVFGLGMVYCWMQAVISHKMRSQAMSSALSSYTRFVLAFLVTVFFIISILWVIVSLVYFSLTTASMPFPSLVEGTKFIKERIGLNVPTVSPLIHATTPSPCTNK